MICVKHKLSQNLDTVEIELFYDCHLGSKKCDIMALKERIERVRTTPNVYCILGGDLINNSTKTSVGDVYAEELSPMEQIKLACSLFAPISDKILGVCSGNHERRSYKQDGIDLTHFFCAELKITDRYDPTGVLMFVSFGSRKNYTGGLKNHDSNKPIQYSIYFTHGDGQGGRTIGGKANGLERRGQIIDADIIITGHTHSPMVFRQKSYRINRQKCSVHTHEQLFVNASSELDYEEYAELYGLRPTSKKSPVIILDGHIEKFLARM